MAKDTTVAAIMAKDTTVDPETGFATVKGGTAIMKTSQATNFLANVNPGDMSVEELSVLKKFHMDGGATSFDVKGFSKQSDEVKLLVQGGTLIFNEFGLLHATGDAAELISADHLEIVHEGERHLRAKVCRPEDSRR